MQWASVPYVIGLNSDDWHWAIIGVFYFITQQQVISLLRVMTTTTNTG